MRVESEKKVRVRGYSKVDHGQEKSIACFYERVLSRKVTVSAH
jgi:hypothetical protein